MIVIYTFVRYPDNNTLFPGIQLFIESGGTGETMTYTERKRIEWLAVNLPLLFLEAYLAWSKTFAKGETFQISHLRRYSHYANSLVFITTLILCSFCVLDIIRHRERDRYPIRLMRYMAASASTTTFIVCVFLLFPMSHFDFSLLLEGSNLLEYIICPVLTYISFTRLGEYTAFGWKETVIATVPAFIYHILIIILNLTGKITGPYSFQTAALQSPGEIVFWFILVTAGSYVVSNALLGSAKVQYEKRELKMKMAASHQNCN